MSLLCKSCSFPCGVYTAENCGYPQLQFMMVVGFPVEVPRPCSHGLAVQQTIEILLLILNMVIDVPVVQVMQVPSYLAVQDIGFFLESIS